MKKCIVFFSILILLFPIVTEAKEYQKNLNFGDVVISVGYDNGKIVYNGQLKYAFTGADRVGAYVNYIDGYSWYCTGVYSSSGGSAHLFADVKATMNGEEVQPSYAPAFNDKTYDVSGVQYMDTGFISEYKGNDASVGISGCPIFSSYEALDKYLSQGIYDEADLISPNGVDEYGNPIKDVVFDKNVPCPQNMRVTLETSNTSALTTTSNFSNINIAWDNLEECDLDNTFIEIQGKFDSFGYYKNAIDYIAKKKTTYNDDSADWITPCSSAFRFKTSNGKYTWYGESKFGSQIDSELGLENKYYLYDYFTSRCGVNFYSLNYYIIKGSVRIRNCMFIDGKMHVSSWVTKLDLNASNGSNAITDETGNPTTVTDDDGNPSDQDYEQNSDSYDSNSSSSSSNESIFGWLARQIDGLNRFFASVKKSFSSATDAGTSFIAMFKSYNSWLPESFFTMLVTGIGIIILLRILGR